jgi:hypothetical protein
LDIWNVKNCWKINGILSVVAPDAKILQIVGPGPTAFPAFSVQIQGGHFSFWILELTEQSPDSICLNLITFPKKHFVSKIVQTVRKIVLRSLVL